MDKPVTQGTDKHIVVNSLWPLFCCCHGNREGLEDGKQWDEKTQDPESEVPDAFRDWLCCACARHLTLGASVPFSAPQGSCHLGVPAGSAIHTNASELSSPAEESIAHGAQQHRPKAQRPGPQAAVSYMGRRCGLCSRAQQMNKARNHTATLHGFGLHRGLYSLLRGREAETPRPEVWGLLPRQRTHARTRGSSQSPDAQTWAGGWGPRPHHELRW